MPSCSRRPGGPSGQAGRVLPVRERRRGRRGHDSLDRRAAVVRRQRRFLGPVVHGHGAVGGRVDRGRGIEGDLGRAGLRRLLSGALVLARWRDVAGLLAELGQPDRLQHPPTPTGRRRHDRDGGPERGGRSAGGRLRAHSNTADLQPSRADQARAVVQGRPRTSLPRRILDRVLAARELREDHGARAEHRGLV
jgi:hypothetical protein